MRLAHQPILSCAIRPVLMSLWIHSYGIRINSTSYSCLSASLTLTSVHLFILHSNLSLHNASWVNNDRSSTETASDWRNKTAEQTGLTSQTNLCSFIQSIQRGWAHVTASQCNKEAVGANCFVPVHLSIRQGWTVQGSWKVGYKETSERGNTD